VRQTWAQQDVTQQIMVAYNPKGLSAIGSGKFTKGRAMTAADAATMKLSVAAEK
jgi:hypothetical protein